jgi:hypothetical protein
VALWAQWCCWCPVPTDFSPKTWIKLDQVMNNKVVDLATNNIFYKGYIGFFYPRQKIFECELWMSAGFGKQWILACNGFFKFFPSKFEMSIYMKVVSLIKIYNFHKGRILSV